MTPVNVNKDILLQGLGGTELGYRFSQYCMSEEAMSSVKEESKVSSGSHAVSNGAEGTLRQ
jgi:hypothetical protein